MPGKNGGAPVTPATDQFYVPYARTVENIRNAAVFAITDLHAAGHPELTAPFARILEALASVDVAALKALDDAHEAGKS